MDEEGRRDGASGFGWIDPAESAERHARRVSPELRDERRQRTRRRRRLRRIVIALVLVASVPAMYYVALWFDYHREWHFAHACLDAGLLQEDGARTVADPAAWYRERRAGLIDGLRTLEADYAGDPLPTFSGPGTLAGGVADDLEAGARFDGPMLERLARLERDCVNQSGLAPTSG